MSQFLYDYQREAVSRMRNGCILNGTVGSGKSRTGLYYYFQLYGGHMTSEGNHGTYTPMTDPPDLYIITTAKKRDDKEWDEELAPFLMSSNPEFNYYNNKVVVDSWQNIKKYIEIGRAFFIFDEDHVTGNGAWTKTFLRIARANQWIILSATPGDNWQDYIPVFIANGFYKNKTEFERRHIRWARFVKYPKVEEYLHTGELVMLRKKVLIVMKKPPNMQVEKHFEDIYCDYDITQYKWICKERWNIWEDRPIKNAAEFCQCLRKVVNGSPDRLKEVLRLYNEHKHKIIVFYNYDYELEALKGLCEAEGITYAEWNGHRHQPIPDSNEWMYLVNYMAGSEAWNCILTNTIVFFSQNYSYKIMVQAAGRIDRANIPFFDLYYYNLKSRSGIDLAITKALKAKKKFNESEFEWSDMAKAEWKE